MISPLWSVAPCLPMKRRTFDGGAGTRETGYLLEE